MEVAVFGTWGQIVGTAVTAQVPGSMKFEVQGLQFKVIAVACPPSFLFVFTFPLRVFAYIHFVLAVGVDGCLLFDFVLATFAGDYLWRAVRRNSSCGDQRKIR